MVISHSIRWYTQIKQLSKLYEFIKVEHKQVLKNEKVSVRKIAKMWKAIRRESIIKFVCSYTAHTESVQIKNW